MYRRTTLAMAALAAMSFAIALPSGDAAAQAANGLSGTWTPVSVTHMQNGKKTEMYGPSPIGSYTFDGGHFSVVILRADLPKFSGNSRTAGTAEENRAVVQGSIAYFGSYVVNDTDKTVTLKVEGATFPNWSGQDQKRTFMLNGDHLTLVNAMGSDGSGSTTIVLKRNSQIVTN
jgi:Lipocalin-like domain